MADCQVADSDVEAGNVVYRDVVLRNLYSRYVVYSDLHIRRWHTNVTFSDRIVALDDNDGNLFV
jgi:hypothetical protein